MRRITLDCETTGFDPRVAGIIEVGGVCFENGQEISSFESLCRPHEICMCGPKVDQALAVSGITRAEIAAARSSDVVREELAGWFAGWAYGATIHAFNVSFDSRFLEVEPWMIRRETWGECIMLAAMGVMYEGVPMPLGANMRKKWPKQSEAGEFFGVGTVHAHRALADARQAAQIYEEVLRRRG